MASLDASNQWTLSASWATASVPFPYDVHALRFAEDAVTLETELHHVYAERRVLTSSNNAREFFFATPEAVPIILAEKAGNLLEYVEKPEAMQYRQSRKFWPEAVLRYRDSDDA